MGNISYIKKRVFASNTHIFVINQYAGAKIKLLTTPGNQLWTPRKFYDQSGDTFKADLIINGSIYNVKTGQAYGENLPDFDRPRPLLAVNKHGNVNIDLLKPSQVWDIKGGFSLLAYGLLVRCGRIDIVERPDILRHPRTLVGRLKDGRLVLVAVEGRSKANAGVTIWQAAKLMLDLGCVQAANLDGGGSTQVIYQGKEIVKSTDSRPRIIANALACYSQ